MSEQSPTSAAPVLSAVDFSEQSRAALLWAARQASLESAPLLVLHVVHDAAAKPGFYDASRHPPGTPIDEIAARMLQEFIIRESDAHPELSALTAAETILVEGLPAGRICEVAVDKGVRLVVIGNVGRSALKSLLLGSVAEDVVRTSAAPVVVVKAAAESDSA